MSNSKFARRVTVEEKSKMIELSKNNKKLTEIASETGFSVMTVSLHTKPKRKENHRRYMTNRYTDPVAREQRREYMRKYMKHRYNTDPEFRKRMNKTAILYAKKRTLTDPAFKEKQRMYSKRYYAKKRKVVK